MCIIAVPHPVGMIPAEDVTRDVDKMFDKIFDSAINWKPAPVKETAAVKPYPANRMTYKGSYADLNKLFADRKWSLGIPIIPPTVDKVEEMLKGTKRDPAEELWVVPPRLGILTVELVATLGVMAGCTPDQMPLLLAVVEAMKHPDMGWSAVTAATGTAVPMILISGPIIEKLGINSGTGVAGPLQPVQNGVGHFVNLVGDVVGGSIPPNFDKSTFSGPPDLVTWVLAENAAANPWKKTYAEQKGFAPTDSVVTVTSAMLGSSHGDHWSDTGTKILNTLGVAAAGSVGAFGACMEEFTGEPGIFGTSQHIFIVFGPEHAASIAQDFPDMEKMKEYLRTKIRRPLDGYGSGLCDSPPEEFLPLTPDTLIPRFKTTQSINIAVSGGAGKWTLIFAPFLSTMQPVSVKVGE